MSVQSEEERAQAPGEEAARAERPEEAPKIAAGGGEEATSEEAVRAERPEEAPKIAAGEGEEATSEEAAPADRPEGAPADSEPSALFELSTRDLLLLDEAEAHDEEGHPLVGQILAERYQVERYIDSGGVGEIYLARDLRLGYREVALKVLKAGTPPDQVARFKREALLTGSLSSPYLTRTSDFGVTDEGRAWLAMEFLHGESLADLLEREKALPLPRALKIIDGALAGLEAAHAAGVVHRDLKPSNIFVVSEPGVHDHAKLLDFGFAKVYAGANALDVTGESQIIVGTVSYMPPEQLRGKPTDHRADLYSVGAVFFRMITGEMPYRARSPQSGGAQEVSMMSAARYRIAHLDDPPRDLRTVHARFEGFDALAEVLMRTLSPEVEGRYESAGALRAALMAARPDDFAARLPPASTPGAAVARWAEQVPSAAPQLAVVPPSGQAASPPRLPAEVAAAQRAQDLGEREAGGGADRHRTLQIAGGIGVGLIFLWFIVRYLLDYSAS